MKTDPAAALDRDFRDATQDFLNGISERVIALTGPSALHREHERQAARVLLQQLGEVRDSIDAKIRERRGICLVLQLGRVESYTRKIRQAFGA